MAFASRAVSRRGIRDRTGITRWGRRAPVAPAGPVSLVVSATDSVTFAEAAARTVTLARAPADTVTFAESLVRTAAHPRTITDSITLAEALTRAALGFNRTRTDTITFAEAVARTVALTRTARSSYFDAVATAAALEGYWRVGETSGTTAVDSSANTRNGTYTAGYTLGDPGGLTGDPNRAVTLNGTTGYVALPATVPSLSGAAATFEGWMKTSDVTKNDQVLYGGYLNGGAFPGWGVIYNLTGSRKIGYYSDVGGGWVESTGTITDTNWHYVAVTVTAGGAVSFYIDGAPAGTAASAAPGNHTGVKAIGATSDGLASFFKGTLDEAAVFSTVLSPATIAQHYSRGIAPGDSLFLSESPTSVNGKTRTVTDQITLSEALTRAALGFSRTPTDTLTLAEALARTVAETRTVTDTLTFAEALAVVLGKTRTTVDTLTLADVLTRGVLGETRTIVDTVTFAEAVTRTKSGARALTDIVTFSESLARAVGETRAPADSITFAETVARATAGARAIADSITFAESVSSVTGGGGLTRTAVDTITLADALTRGALSGSRGITDSVTFAEALARTSGRTRTIADAATFAEAVTKSGIGHNRTITDAITLAEALTRSALALQRALVGQITFAEAVVAVVSGAITAVGRLEGDLTAATSDAALAVAIVDAALGATNTDTASRVIALAE